LVYGYILKIISQNHFFENYYLIYKRKNIKLDKFSNKYLNKFDILKYAIIGFEFEFFTTRPYHKLLEILNRELVNVKVSGYRVYHSSFTPTANHWKIEPDLSLGFNGVELISGPLPYVDAKVYLLKVLKILQGPEFSTDDKCSIHINLSFDRDKSPRILDDLNKLKLILNIDENFVYKYFPTRENNFYAKTIKRLIPFKSFDFSNNAANILLNSLELPDTKYYGVNFLNIFNGRIEYRYIGAEDYQFKTAEILDLMDYFIELTWNCITTEFTEDDMNELKEYLSDNINQFKNFSKLDNFIAEFPSISLQIDMNSELIILRTYYEQLYDELYEIITNIYNLSNCIINYNTENQRLELVDANFKTIFDIKKLDIIDSVIDGGSFTNCNLINCEIKNAHFNNCQIISCDVYKSKIESSKIYDGSVVHDSYIYNCFLDAQMKGGVFRSGSIGENAEIDKTVKVITGDNNYFGNNQESDKTKTLSDFKNTSYDKKKWMTGHTRGGTKQQTKF
jgi:uncharacterized protein YjbI with pentapeptide repeats